MLKKNTYTAKTYDEAVNQALADLMDVQDNLFIKEIESSKGLFSKKSVIEVVRKDNYLKIILHPENSSILIGKEGRTLSSIQNVLRAVLTKETGMHINIILDVENYKEKSQRHIERLAKNLAKEVQKTKEPVRMDSMNSYERRLIHEVLKDFKGITTESEGEEPNRAVVIKPTEE